MIDYVSIPEDRIKRLRRNRKMIAKFENLSNVKLSLNKQVSLECEDPIKMMKAKSIIKAFGRGFTLEDSLYLLDDKYTLCVINIKDYSKGSSSRLKELKGRVIGRKGKSKRIIEKHTNAKISVYGKTVGIIGTWSSVELAKEAVCMLLEGRKHGTVFTFLKENIKRIKY